MSVMGGPIRTDKFPFHLKNPRDHNMALTRQSYSDLTQRRYADDVCAGKPVRIQSLTELERSKIEAACGEDFSDIRARLIAASLVDEDGNRIFTDEAEDIAFIMNMDSAFIAPVSDLIQAHSQWSDLADAVKNSPDTLGEDSPSSLQIA